MKLSPMTKIVLFVVGNTVFFSFLGASVPQGEQSRRGKVEWDQVTPDELIDYGRRIFNGKGTCYNCHSVGAAGATRCPNLSDIGAVRSAASLLQSLLSPSAEIIPLNREIRAVTRRGRTVTGRRMNEDTYSIQLMDAEGRLISLIKAELHEMTVLESSSMPSSENQVTADELADIVAYLRSLKTVD